MGTVRVDMPRWLADRNGTGACSVDAEVEKVTPRAILISGAAAVDKAVRCFRCGKDLTHPTSRALGVGPDCAEELGLPWQEDPADVEALKETVKDRTRFEKVWLPRSQISINGTRGFDWGEKAEPERYTCSFYVLGDMIRCDVPYAANPIIKKILACTFDPNEKEWTIPATPNGARQLAEAFFGRSEFKVQTDGTFQSLLSLAIDQQERQDLKEVEHLPDVPESKTVAWAHQRQAYWFAAPLPASMLAMDMGTGKSKVVVDMITNRGHEKVLIVCPKSVFVEWPKQFARHSGRPVTVNVLDDSLGTIIDRASFARKALKANVSPTILVINYEAAWREPFASFSLMAGFDMVVLDEIHRIKSAKGKTSKHFERLGALVPHKVGLTGTPMPHSPLDVFGQYRFLDPGLFGTVWYRFRDKYAVMGGYKNKQVVGYRNLDDLNEKFYSIAYRVSADVLDLPDERDIDLTIRLSLRAKAWYEEVQGEYRQAKADGRLEREPGLILTTMLTLQQATSGIKRHEDGGGYDRVGTEKRDTLSDLLLDLPPEEPVVVFARFTADLEAIEEASKAAKKPYGEVSGRRSDLEDFQQGAVDVLGVQIQAGSEGIDLTRARYAIYYSLGFSLKDYLQSRRRIHRPGQDRKVVFYHLIAEGTVDEKVYAALADRKEIVDYVLEEL